MTSMQDRLKLKRVSSMEAWSIREQLCLASSVLKSGDQNWMSVSRSLKPFVEKDALRPPDWFSQKSCAIQYACLLENADTPRRKKRESGETTSESIVRRLTQERIAELNQILSSHRDEYLKHKMDLMLLRSSMISEEKLEKMWVEMQQEEREQEQKARTHSAWLVKRQQKQEINLSPTPSTLSSHRKLTESVETQEPSAEISTDDDERKQRGGRSPLLTSLLKSPSPTTQMQTTVSMPIHASSPTITSLLGSSSKLLNTQLTQSVSPQLQQLVSTAIASVASVTPERPSVGAPTLSMLLEMPASTQRGPLPNLQAVTSTATIIAPQTMTVAMMMTTTTMTTAVTTAVTAATTTAMTTMMTMTTTTPTTTTTLTTTTTMTTITTTTTTTMTTTTTTTTPTSTAMPTLTTATQQAIVATVHNFPQAQQQPNVHHPVTVQSIKVTSAMSMPAASATLAIPVTPAAIVSDIPVSDNMVQIIDHIDDVIRKDIIADVMDKDEINEIIGDIEELIKEEITANSPQTLQETSRDPTATATTATLDNLTVVQVPQQVTEVPAIVADSRTEPRNVDEAVSLSDSPHSEMAIEEIDSSTSNIAEIIGTVAIKPQETKIAQIMETVSGTSEKAKSEMNICDEKVTLAKELVPKLEKNNEDENKSGPIVMEEKQSDIEAKPTDTMLTNLKTEENEQGKLLLDMKETLEETALMKNEGVDEKEAEEKKQTIIATDDKDVSECVKEQKESPEDAEDKVNASINQVEVHLAKITEDQQDIPSTEVVNILSETNDLPSAEDTEKSQDISLILEEKNDTEETNGQSTENKKKEIEQIVENIVENTTEVLESSEKEPIILKEKAIVDVKEEPPVKLQEKVIIEETLKICTKELKKEEAEEVMNSSEDITNSILQEKEMKKEEIDESIEDIEGITTHTVITEEIENVKSESIAEVIATDVENVNTKKTETTEIKLEELKPETKTETIVQVLLEEDLKKESTEVKEEKEDVKESVESEQSIKKETESGMVSAGEEPGELDEEESSLSKLSGGRAMKTYSKRQQNVAVDSETENEGTGEGTDYRAWKRSVMLAYNRLATHKYASIFLRPITEDQAPGYHSVIFRPMDLSTIKKNIDNGTIRSTMHFQRDVMLMFQNAIMYNKHDTFIFKMAVTMQEECLQHMQILVQVTGEGTFRRETRTAASSSSEASESSVKRKRSHITPSPHDTDTPRSKKRRKSEND